MDGVAPHERAAVPRWGARRGWAIPALVFAPILVFASVAIGLRFPGGADAEASALAPLDYSRGPTGTVSPLRDSFIADVLGGVITRPGTAGRGQTPPPGGPAGPFAHPPTPVIDHALTNDDVAHAYRIDKLPFTGRTDTAGATREPEEPTACSPVGDTVWYRFRPTTTMGLIADTAGSDRPVSLAVFQGDTLIDFSTSDDWCATHARGNARVSFAAYAGTTFHFQVSTLSPGPVLFTLRPQGSTSRLLPDLSDEPDHVFSPWAYPSPDGRYVTYGGFLPSQQRSRCVGATTHVQALPEQVCRAQAFIYDRATKRSVHVSTAPRGEPANDTSVGVNMSASGRHVVMASWASNLVEGDRNTCLRWHHTEGSCLDVFVRDRDVDGDGLFDEEGASRTVLVSVSSSGVQGNASAGPSWISTDGRYVTFQSWADNLVADDHNGIGDVFTHDRDADADGIFDEEHPGARRTWRVSVSSRGAEASVDELKGTAPGPLLAQRDYVPIERANTIMGTSTNGRFVMFRSAATNLDPRCASGAHQAYVHDNVTGRTTCVSVSSHGSEGNKGVRLHNLFTPKISDDGRYAVFNSDATNLVHGDTNQEEDLFVRDLMLGKTERASVTWEGKQAEGEGPSVGRDAIFGVLFTYGSMVEWTDVYTMSELNHTLSADGRYLFFSSGAHNLVPGDTNEVRDIFARDLWRGTTTLVSVSTSGVQSEAASNAPSITPDGSLLMFYSLGDDLDDDAAASNEGLEPYVYLRTFSGGAP